MNRRAQLICAWCGPLCALLFFVPAGLMAFFKTGPFENINRGLAHDPGRGASAAPAVAAPTPQHTLVEA